METAQSFIDTLKAKEAELVAQLEESPLWQQIQGIRSTIKLFTEPNNGTSLLISGIKVVPTPPKEYPIEGTWGAKILFILGKITGGYVDDIMTQMKQYEHGKYTDDELLYKRVSQNASILKTNGKISGVNEGTKVKYYKK